MPGIHGMGIENAHERRVLEDERVGFAAYDSAKVTILR
jgi:hypothetical protein